MSKENDDILKTGHALNFCSIDSGKLLNVEKNYANLERNDIDLLDYLSVDEIEMKPVGNENDVESERNDKELPNYLSVNKNEFKHDNEKDDCKMSYDVHDHFKDDIDDVHDCSENEGDNIHSDYKNEFEGVHDFCVDDSYNIHGQSEENIHIHNYCKDDDIHSSCEDDNDDIHSSCEDDNDDIRIQDCFDDKENIYDQCEDDKENIHDHCEDDNIFLKHCKDDDDNILEHCEDDNDNLKNYNVDNLGGDAVQNNSDGVEELDRLATAKENGYVDVIETGKTLSEYQSAEVTSITISYEDDQVSADLEKDSEYVGFDNLVSEDLSFENITEPVTKVNATEIVNDNCDEIRNQEDIRYDNDSDLGFENCKTESLVSEEKFDTKLGICINTELLKLEEKTCSTKYVEEAITENDVDQTCAITNTNISKECICPQIGTEFLDNNSNVLQKNSVKCEISDEQYTKADLENIVNDFSTIDNQSCDEKLSECIYNKDLHDDVFGSISLPDGNSNFSSVFHFTVSENNFDSSSHENFFTHTDATAKESQHKIFSETENVVLYDYKPLSVATEEHQFKISKDVWDENEQGV